MAAGQGQEFAGIDLLTRVIKTTRAITTTPPTPKPTPTQHTPILKQNHKIRKTKSATYARRCKVYVTTWLPERSREMEKIWR